MDVSQNLIDLRYLVNPLFTDAIDVKQHINTVKGEDLQYYKKRIFLLTKDFLQGKQTNNDNMNKVFDKFAAQCISYFKFNDKKEIIQGDYKDMVNKKKDTIIKKDEDPNNFIMRKPEPKVPKITDHINIKSTKTSKQIVIPQIRNLEPKKKKKKKK